MDADEAKQTLAAQGYRIERIWAATDWTRSPLVWLLAAIAASGLVALTVWFPALGIAASIVLGLVGAWALERHRRQEFDAQHHRLKIAVARSHRAQLRLLNERRKREEVLLDLAVQRILAQLRQRRQEEEDTLVMLGSSEDTLLDDYKRSELRRELERKRSEIVRLESELRRIEAGAAR